MVKEEGTKLSGGFFRRYRVVMIGAMVIAAVIFGVLYYFGGQDSSGFKIPRNKSSMHRLPSCQDRQTLFTSLPVAETDFRSVEPLGGFSPEVFHIFPIKHTYWTGTAREPQQQTDVNLYAPGDGWITYVETEKHAGASYTDNFIYFSPCREVEVYFFHLKSVSDKILAEFKNPKCYEKDVSGKGMSIRCDKKVKVAVVAGELIGTVNNKEKGIGQLFDFGMSDWRRPELNFANKERWRESGFDLLHMVCPADYFTAELKQIILSKTGDMNGDHRRTAEPICGEYMQDKIGTAQGVWFQPGTDNKESDEPGQLTLSYHNVQTEKGIFAVGNSLGSSGIENGAYYFKQKTRGAVDRPFDEVAADGKIYCYEPAALDGQYRYPFRILITMPTSTTIKIEGQSENLCGSGPWQFTGREKTFER